MTAASPATTLQVRGRDKVMEPYRLRRRLRQVRWKEWKTTAARRHNLRIRGISESNVRKWGGSSKGYWRIAGSQVLGVALPNTYWDHLGLKTLTATRQRLNPTADEPPDAGPHVRGERGRGNPAPYSIQAEVAVAFRRYCWLQMPKLVSLRRLP